MLGIPVEIFTALSSAAITFIGSIIAIRAKAKADEHMLLMEKLTAQREAYQEAREFNTREAKWSRRIVTFAATFAILIWPAFAPLVGLEIVTGWTEIQGGFWPFSSPKPKMVWHTVSGGIVLTPLHTHTLSAIVGFYFGSSVAEHARR